MLQLGALLFTITHGKPSSISLSPKRISSRNLTVGHKLQHEAHHIEYDNTFTRQCSPYSSFQISLKAAPLDWELILPLHDSIKMA